MRWQTFKNQSWYIKTSSFKASLEYYYFQDKYNCFDVREVNMNKYNPDVHKGYLLIRFLERLLLADLKIFQEKMLKKDLIVHGSVLTPHWEFNIQEAAIISAINQTDKKEKFELYESSKQQLVARFSG